MINSNAYPDQFDLVDPSSHADGAPRKLASCSGQKTTLSTIWNNKPAVETLCRITPKLIQWRLFVFYGAFFTGPKYDPMAFLHEDDNPSTTTPTEGRTVQKSTKRKPSVYAAYKARNEADLLLESLQKDIARLDLIAFHEWYLSDKKAYQHRCYFAKVRSTALLPALKVVLAVSAQLDIPVRQLELAMSMYVCYAKILETNPVEIKTNRQGCIYNMLDAGRMASSKEWPTLAQVFYDDFKDISTFSILCTVERAVQARCADMKACLEAVKACRCMTFAEIKNDWNLCQCGCQDGHANFWKPRGQHGSKKPIHNGDTKRAGGLSESSTLHPFCFMEIKDPLNKVTSMHARCKVGPSRSTVSYTFNKAEQTRTNGSFGLTMQELRKPIARRRPPKEKARHSRACLTEMKRDGIDSLAPLLEISGEA